MAAEDVARNAQGLATQAQTQAEDLANKAVTKGQIFVIEQVVNSLPAPVNFAAKALGEGLYAAFKFPITAVIQPAAPNEDPIKLMAFAMAFAILKAIWCFIKGLLNPLPIIGIFFPLCSDDAQLADGTDKATIAARNKAQKDPDNKALGDATANYLAIQQAEKRTLSNLETVAESSGMDAGQTGMTFDEFVAQTANMSAMFDPNDQGPTDALKNQINQGTTTANIPPQPAAEPEWKQTEPTTYQEFRKLFGL